MYKFAKKVANHEGFTLVELIVVIAILGILAGIAIPVYSGYINKANQAADVMLLGAVNTALAAACAENDFVTLSGAEIELREAGGKKYIDGVSVTVMADELTTADLVALSFETYFGENKNTELKYCTSKDDFVWDSTTQTFSIDGVGGGSSTTPSMAELVDSLKPLIVSAIAGSNFEDKENELLDRLQSLTNAAESMDVTTLNTMLNGAFGTFLSEKGIDTTDMQAVANAATLFVAEQMSGLSTENKESIIAAWKTNQFDPSKGVDDIMRRYSGMGLSTLGGMATYYANTEAMVQYVIDNYKDVDGVNQAGIDNFISAYEALPSALAAATDTAGMYQAIYNAQTQMVAALQTAGNTDLKMNIANYGTSNAEADANAFMNAMSSINGNLDALLSYVGEDNLYTLISSLLN